jgi:hypothetical protein
MQHFICSEAGYNHLNEDTIVVQAHPENPKILLCALADGQGGRSGGAEASRIATEKCLQIASSFSIEQPFDVASLAQTFPLLLKLSYGPIGSCFSCPTVFGVTSAMRQSRRLV